MLGLSACATTRPTPEAPLQVAAFGHWATAGVLEPYQARGSAQVTYRGSAESGDFTVQVEPGPRFRAQLRARVTGSLALDVRFDDADLLIIDYVHESYLLSANTADARREQFSIDLSPLDFRIALTGRVPEELIRGGSGPASAPATTFAHEGAEYRFVLGAEGWPTEWTKWKDGQLVARVEYRGYLEYRTGAAVVRLPERIRIYAGEPQPRLVIGLRDWHIGPDPGAGPISFIPPQDVLDRFRAQ